MFKILNLPQDQDQAKAAAEYLASAMNKFQIVVNGTMFADLWADGSIKVLIEEENQEIVGVCFLRHGKNVLAQNLTATVLEIKSLNSPAPLYEFACTIAQALGCDRITSVLEKPLDGIEVSAYYQEKRL